MGFQYLTRGVCAGHGPQALQAVQVPVRLSGMDVAPGEIVHMDENGAVKFPGQRLEEVVTNAKKLLEHEEDRVGRLLQARGFEEVRAIMGTHLYAKKK